MSITQLFGDQIYDNEIGLAKMFQDFLAGQDWDMTDGNLNATLTGLKDAIDLSSPATLGQVQALINAAVNALSKPGLNPVKTIAQTNIALTGVGQTINGYVVQAGDRIAVFGQTTSTEDGIYVAAAGAWARDTAEAIGEDIGSRIFAVEAGTDADSVWLITNDTGSGVVGTDDLTVGKVGEQTVQPTEVWGEKPTVTNGLPTVTLNNTPLAGTERVYLSGARQDRGATEDYTIVGNTITFTFNLKVNGGKAHKVLVDYKHS